MAEKELPVKLAAANDNVSPLWKMVKENQTAIYSIITAVACGAYLEWRHHISSKIFSLIGL